MWGKALQNTKAREKYLLSIPHIRVWSQAAGEEQDGERGELRGLGLHVLMAAAIVITPVRDENNDVQVFWTPGLDYLCHKEKQGVEKIKNKNKNKNKTKQREKNKNKTKQSKGKKTKTNNL